MVRKSIRRGERSFWRAVGNALRRPDVIAAAVLGLGILALVVLLGDPSEVQLGTVGDWLAGLGAFGAIVFALVEIRTQRGQIEEERIERRRESFRQLAVWLRPLLQDVRSALSKINQFEGRVVRTEAEPIKGFILRLEELKAWAAADEELGTQLENALAALREIVESAPVTKTDAYGKGTNDPREFEPAIQAARAGDEAAKETLGRLAQLSAVPSS